MLSLAEELRTVLASGLQRRAVQTPSQWAEKYRIMGGKTFPGPWRFKHFPWLREVMDRRCAKRVMPKGAQLGFTEAALNKVLYNIDVNRIDCLYLLPTKSPDANNFSAARFDPAVELSPHLQQLFSDVKNVNHKRAGSTNLYVRGMQSESGLRSIPAGMMVIDEYDVCEPKNVRLAIERMSGQIEKELWEFSTPTYPDFGIDVEYKETTQEHFMFPCPRCGKWTELDFPDALVITADKVSDPSINDSHFRLPCCKGRFDHHEKTETFEKARYFSTVDNPNYDISGFYVNQFYSAAKNPIELARDGLRARLNPLEKKEYYNSSGGLPYAPEGSKVTAAHINACIRDYKMGVPPFAGNKIITMGVDVGAALNVEINSWEFSQEPGKDLNANSKPRLLLATELNELHDFSKLEQYMYDYQINAVVIDAQPETRIARMFADKFYPHVKLCYYTGNKNNVLKISDETKHTISADRTYWLDVSFRRFLDATITLPNNLPFNYSPQIEALVRDVRQDPVTGEYVAKYIHTKPDHYAHARLYNELALVWAMTLQTNGSNIASFL